MGGNAVAPSRTQIIYGRHGLSRLEKALDRLSRQDKWGARVLEVLQLVRMDKPEDRQMDRNWPIEYLVKREISQA